MRKFIFFCAILFCIPSISLLNASRIYPDPETVKIVKSTILDDSFKGFKEIINTARNEIHQAYDRLNEVFPENQHIKTNLIDELGKLVSEIEILLTDEKGDWDWPAIDDKAVDVMRICYLLHMQTSLFVIMQLNGEIPLDEVDLSPLAEMLLFAQQMSDSLLATIHNSQIEFQ